MPKAAHPGDGTNSNWEGRSFSILDTCCPFARTGMGQGEAKKWRVVEVF